MFYPLHIRSIMFRGVLNECCAVAALAGWFEYCAGDAAPMDELERLELAAGEADAADVTDHAAAPGA